MTMSKARAAREAVEGTEKEKLREAAFEARLPELDKFIVEFQKAQTLAWNVDQGELVVPDYRERDEIRDKARWLRTKLLEEKYYDLVHYYIKSRGLEVR